MEPDGIAGHALVPSNGPAHERAWQHHVSVFAEIGDGWQVACINRYYIYIRFCLTISNKTNNKNAWKVMFTSIKINVHAE